MLKGLFYPITPQILPLHSPKCFSMEKNVQDIHPGRAQGRDAVWLRLSASAQSWQPHLTKLWMAVPAERRDKWSSSCNLLSGRWMMPLCLVKGRRGDERKGERWRETKAEVFSASEPRPESCCLRGEQHIQVRERERESE